MLQPGNVERGDLVQGVEALQLVAERRLPSLLIPEAGLELVGGGSPIEERVQAPLYPLLGRDQLPLKLVAPGGLRSPVRPELLKPAGTASGRRAGSSRQVACGR
jgi:hypothetical protein